jgi:hypothetical protein
MWQTAYLMGVRTIARAATAALYGKAGCLVQLVFRLLTCPPVVGTIVMVLSQDIFDYGVQRIPVLFNLFSQVLRNSFLVVYFTTSVSQTIQRRMVE